MQFLPYLHSLPITTASLQWTLLFFPNMFIVQFNEFIVERFYCNISSHYRYCMYSKILLLRPLEIKTTLTIKNTCFSSKMQFSMQIGFSSESCSIFRPLSTSTNGSLIIGTSLYLHYISSMKCFCM